jgi:hypothetical protein
MADQVTPRLADVATKTLITAPMSASRGCDLFLTAAKKLLRELVAGRPPMEMYPGEIDGTLEYQRRLGRLRTPDPFEGEATEARSCFLLRYYSGKRECFFADTDTQELIPLSFFASYRGQPEHHPDLEIGTPKG